MSHPITAITPQNITKVLELAASGHTQSAIAKALGISVRSVQRILADPLAKQALADLRLVLRVQALQGAQAIVPDTQTWLAEVVKAKTSAKDADALSRALLNLEKVAASASGENRPQAQPGQQVNVVVTPGWVKAPGQAQATVMQAAPKPVLLPHLPDDL
jgi:hypothetical protein